MGFSETQWAQKKRFSNNFFSGVERKKLAFGSQFATGKEQSFF
jgi:hypothetical protein